MRRLTLLSILFVAGAMIASAQSSGGGDTTKMMAPSDSNMAAPADSMMKSSSDSMMGEDMSYDTLKKTGKLADVKMGMQLRAAMSTGMKVTYKNLMSAEALAMKSPTVLFFSADWCPYCQADLKDINANGAKLGKVNVVVVDYDTSADLKMKYGITTQDSYVQIGTMGEKIAIWNGGGVDGILKNLKNGM